MIEILIMELIEVKFTKSPTGAFGLAYNAGQVGHVTPEMAKELEEAGYIEPLQAKPAEKVEDTADKAAAKRETRPGRGKTSGRRKKSE